MKRIPFRLIMISTIICSAFLFGSGCSKKAVDTPEMSGGGSSGTDINYPPAENSGYNESTIATEGNLDDTGNADNAAQTGNLSINTPGMEASEEYKRQQGRSTEGLKPIYFNFDQASIRSDMVEVMNNNALYLKQMPGSSVVIEGNCDERGTNEYNLALGQRRALNAKKYLINLGIDEQRIRTITYGEERPLFLGQDEESYSFNRRGDFILE